MQNINNRRFRIWKNKSITKFKKKPTNFIDKIYLYTKDPYEAKYQYLINIRAKAVLKRFNDPKAFI